MLITGFKSICWSIAIDRVLKITYLIFIAETESQREIISMDIATYWFNSIQTSIGNRNCVFLKLIGFILLQIPSIISDSVEHK